MDKLLHIIKTNKSSIIFYSIASIYIYRLDRSINQIRNNTSHISRTADYILEDQRIQRNDKN